MIEQKGAVRKVDGKAQIKQPSVVDQLMFGISRIVEKFAICDLEKNQFEYYELGNEQNAHLSGQYQELVNSLAREQTVNLENQGRTIEQLLSIEHIQEILRSPKDIYTFEYMAYTQQEKNTFKLVSLVPLEWRGEVLAKIMLIVQDVGKKHELEDLANTDSLTGLRNERSLSTILRSKIEQKQRFALFFLDLDMFKSVNDTYGHSMGDRLLQAVAQRLIGCIRKTDYASRVGGDEFALVITRHSLDEAACQCLKSRIKETIDSPFHIDECILHVDTSCGYAIYPDSSDSIKELRELADRRMYQDKAVGRHNRYFIRG